MLPIFSTLIWLTQVEAQQQAIPLLERRQRIRHRALELGAVALLRQRHLGGTPPPSRAASSAAPSRARCSMASLRSSVVNCRCATTTVQVSSGPWPP